MSSVYAGCYLCRKRADETIQCTVCKIPYFCSVECRVNHEKTHVSKKSDSTIYVDKDGNAIDIKEDTDTEAEEDIPTDPNIFMAWKKDHDALFRSGLTAYYKQYDRENILLFTVKNTFIVQTLNEMLGSEESDSMSTNYITHIIQIHTDANENDICIMTPIYKENKVPYFSKVTLSDNMINSYKQLAATNIYKH
jgi:hypothetical protein